MKIVIHSAFNGFSPTSRCTNMRSTKAEVEWIFTHNFPKLVAIFLPGHCSSAREHPEKNDKSMAWEIVQRQILVTLEQKKKLWSSQLALHRSGGRRNHGNDPLRLSGLQKKFTGHTFRVVVTEKWSELGWDPDMFPFSNKFISSFNSAWLIVDHWLDSGRMKCKSFFEIVLFNRFSVG
jgi:hypothetical protein